MPGNLTERALRLSVQALNVVPDLRGYVGVDMVLGLLPDGSQDSVIEINPRLTTSYIGLRALAKFNLAEVLINIALGKGTNPLKWRTGPIHFHSDGRVINSTSHG